MREWLAGPGAARRTSSTPNFVVLVIARTTHVYIERIREAARTWIFSSKRHRKRTGMGLTRKPRPSPGRAYEKLTIAAEKFHEISSRALTCLSGSRLRAEYLELI